MPVLIKWFADSEKKDLVLDILISIGQTKTQKINS